MALIETAGATGQSLYVNIRALIAGVKQIWNTTLNGGAGGWESYNSGHWSQYAIPLTEDSGSGYYSATYPAAIVGVLTTEVLYANGTPTLGDVPVSIWQSQGTNVGAVGGDGTAPAKFQASLASMVVGAAASGTLAPNQFSSNLTNPNINAFVGRDVLFATGSLVGEASTIEAYDPTSGVITVSAPFTAAPSISDVFVIV